MEQFDPAASPAHAALHEVLSRRAGIEPADVSFAIRLYDRPLRAGAAGRFADGEVMSHLPRQARYPASVMKLFVLNMLATLRATGEIEYDPEDDRAARAMIGISSNEATVYLIGRMTGAEDGGPLYGAELEDWFARRQFMRNFYERIELPEFKGINILHGTYEDSPYGRAFQVRAPQNANRLTALAAATLMHDVMRGALPGAEWMQELLSRDFQRRDGPHEGDQAATYLAGGLPDEMRCWSKAGNTSTARHDLLYGERPDGRSLLIAIMTEGSRAAADETLLTEFARVFHSRVFC
ncbi:MULTISPECIES: serine hydrolase [unclassified Haematobacter]|uniref:serine hydrolase n=1 Tax=unclassified Haematobacter TaxID=2640585 RepID=UPI0025C4A8A9|nr:MULTISPECIES: serine hydrolase [unclassified Haematobacter]